MAFIIGFGIFCLMIGLCILLYSFSDNEGLNFVMGVFLILTSAATIALGISGIENKELIVECEKELQRTQHCKIVKEAVIVPIKEEAKL